MDLTAKFDQAERKVAGLDLRRIIESPFLDIAVGVGLFLLALDQLGAFDGYLSLLGTLSAGLATLPQIFRRRMPLVVVGLTALGALGLLLSVGGNLFGLSHPVYASGLLSAYTIFRHVSRGASWLLCGVTICGVAIVPVLLGVWSRFPFAMPFVLTTAAALAAAAFLADVRRSRTEIRQVRADNVEALREQAAMGERARIAREMHDVVAHSISLIAVRAEAAPYTLKDLPDPVKAEFAEIATAARETLGEMRRLLGVLRADSGAETALDPQPGLERVRELIERHGGEVDLDIVGEERPLPQAVDVSAYRIIQECLANARTHAPGSRVSIELAYQPNLLAIRVADNGPGPAQAGSPNDPAQGDVGGHGLIGMRERALALDGWFSAEPGPNGGFIVRAGLPTE
ncbi:sensor histidine kinase [Microtetraspora sp. NBRC 16547]|uniref:sensor histidine kinase n=1 Tax=Microtetraspora sp. NBRC 16547 TaxID=3030993 RepID=UPI0024A1784A|nr:sensor histidine kinase [Microtetraspora sp. NBRC 16547]GLW96015.1 two-component sensor histidine kinase [Microtetraspora sp. NBRC 16547]